MHLHLLVAVAVQLASPVPPAAPAPTVSPALSQAPFPPHRIADNLYYVGSEGLASYLVTSRKGHILINPSFESTVPLIRRNVEALGFKFTEVKILLNSHAHDDHVGGMALARQLTGAAVQVMRGDHQTIESGGDKRWKPSPVDRVLEDGATVTLGEVTLRARLTPGHTRGCTTWTMRAKDRGKTLDVVIVGSPNVNPGYVLVDNQDYPQIASDYQKSFQIWKALPCDIFLGAHGNYYGLADKHPLLAKSDKNPFVDPQGYRAYIEERERAFRQRLAEQQSRRPPADPTPPSGR